MLLNYTDLRLFDQDAGEAQSQAKTGENYGVWKLNELFANAESKPKLLDALGEIVESAMKGSGKGYTCVGDDYAGEHFEGAGWNKKPAVVIYLPSFLEFAQQQPAFMEKLAETITSATMYHLSTEGNVRQISHIAEVVKEIPGLKQTMETAINEGIELYISAERWFTLRKLREKAVKDATYSPVLAGLTRATDKITAAIQKKPLSAKQVAGLICDA